MDARQRGGACAMPTLAPAATPEVRSSRAAVVVGPVSACAPGFADLAAALAKLQRGGRAEVVAAPHGAAVYLVVVPSPAPVRGRPLDPPVTVLRPRVVKRAIDAMEADPARPFTVADLAAA